MPMKETGPATDPERREWAGGFAWVAHPEEGMRRASHALDGNDGVWLVDPVDFDGLDDRLDDEVAGVTLLLGRHERDAAAIARRHDTTVHLPVWIDDVDDGIDAPVERFEDRLGTTDYRARTVDTPFWQEAALWDGETLIVPEAIGSAEHFRARGERLGVHPVLRLVPPRSQFDAFDPERVLTGHGMGVFDDASAALSDALAGARRRAPSLYLNMLREMVT